MHSRNLAERWIACERSTKPKEAAESGKLICQCLIQYIFIGGPQVWFIMTTDALKYNPESRCLCTAIVMGSPWSVLVAAESNFTQKMLQWSSNPWCSK